MNTAIKMDDKIKIIRDTMKKPITIVVLMLAIIGCSQEKKCSDFKTGKFEYFDPNYVHWKVTRTDSTQTEISTKNGVEIYSSIEWKSECEYLMTYIRIENSSIKDLIGKTISFEIIKTSNKKYTLESTIDKISKEWEMIKVD